MPQELREGKISYIRREAMEQSAAGATLLDVNVGAPGIDEPAAMERAVFCVTGAVTAPLVLDSSNPEALERGLKAADGKVLINSVSGEEKSLGADPAAGQEIRGSGHRSALDESGHSRDRRRAGCRGRKDSRLPAMGRDSRQKMSSSTA